MLEVQEERQADSVMLPSEDPVAHTGLDVGDVPTTSESDDGIDPNSDPVAKRAVKPVICLSYDEPGEPTDRPSASGDEVIHRQ